MKKKFIFLAVAALAIPCISYAQEEKQKHSEWGFTTGSLTGLGSFNVELKRGDDNKYVRYSFILTQGNLSITNQKFGLATPGSGITSSEFVNTDNRIGFGIGLEKRKVLRPRLSFLHGPNISLSGYFTRQETENSRENITVTELAGAANFGWRLGVMYHITDQLYCSAEVMPGIGYQLLYTEELRNPETPFEDTTKETTLSHTPSLSLSSGGLRLGLFYKF